MLKKLLCCILLLGILPCDAALFTWFQNPELGQQIVRAMNVMTCVAAGFCLLLNMRSYFRYEKTCIKYLLYFIALALINAMAAAFTGEMDALLVRTMSLLCVCAYYLFAIYVFKDADELLKTVNLSLLLLIVMSVVLYYTDYENATFIELAGVRYFKGVAANRNSYAEITLFYVMTNIYLWVKSKKHGLYYIATTALAVYTTFITHSATATICMVVMGALVLVYLLTGKTVSFKVALIGYAIIFVSLIILRSANTPFLGTVIEFFNKDNSLTGRTDIWEVAFSVITEHPIFGQGYDTQRLLYFGLESEDPHNSILYTLLTQGIVGLVLFAWFFGKTVFRGERLLKGDLRYSMLYIYVLTWMLRGLTESVFSYPHFVFWVALIVIDMQAWDKKRELAAGKDRNEGEIYKYAG